MFTPCILVERGLRILFMFAKVLRNTSYDSRVCNTDARRHVVSLSFADVLKEHVL